MPVLFLLCLFARFAIAYIAKTFPDALTLMGLLALIVAIGFTLIYLFNLRPTGIEAGGRIWWNNMRPVHAALYALFAYLAVVKGFKNAWMVLLADAILGTVIFSLKYANLAF